MADLIHHPISLLQSKVNVHLYGRLVMTVVGFGDAGKLVRFSIIKYAVATDY